MNQDGELVVFEALFLQLMPHNLERLQPMEGLVVIDRAPHMPEFDVASSYDPRTILHRVFVLRRYTPHFFECMQYKKKLVALLKSPKRFLAVYPDITFEQINESALAQRLNGKVYPKYDCHAFVDRVISGVCGTAHSKVIAALVSKRAAKPLSPLLARGMVAARRRAGPGACPITKADLDVEKKKQCVMM